MSKSSNALALVALACCLAGCAQERAPIDRVQANALAKAFFVGADLASASDDPEFFARGTVVDIGFGAAQDGLFTSTYAQPVSRIRWEITEALLNARLSYELVEGTDGKGNRTEGVKGGAVEDGQVVASYRIVSHFDVKRAYNPTTGEELNVVEENTTDRPWHKRDHFRVDWSSNLATDTYAFDTLSMLGAYGGVKYEPLAYYVAAPTSPDAPVFDLSGGYFDVTVKAFARPQLVDTRALGWTIDQYPACWLPTEFAGGTRPYGNCNPVELTIRQSYRRVPRSDFVPEDVDGVRFQAAGSFAFAERFGYERSYGMVDDRWVRFASRYNLFERGHYWEDANAMTGPVACATPATTIDPTARPDADPNRDENQNGTADECEDVTARTNVGGSQCDTFNHTCTLPQRLRKPVTIPWYVVGTSDEAIFEATEWAAAEWDLAMRTALRVSRLVECRRTGDSGCEDAFPMWTGQQDDIDDAAAIAREAAACRRSEGEDSEACRSLVDDRAASLAKERGEASNPAAIASLLKEPPVFVLCHSPVRDGDARACGARGLTVRPGDLRYNVVNVIETPQTAAPWGIMVDADDPLSGEKVAVSVNVWNAVTDVVSQELVDMARYANGELATADLTNGEHVRRWVEAAEHGAPGAAPQLGQAQVDAQLAGIAGMDVAGFRQALQRGPSEETKAVLAKGTQTALDAAASAELHSPSRAAAQTRLAMARGTEVESELMNRAMLQLSGLPANAPAAGLADLASPLATNNALSDASFEELREQALARRGVCMLSAGPEPSGIVGVAKGLKRKFAPRADETPYEARARAVAMREYVRRRLHYGVVIHEMGHSVGLRHNFSSSAAPLFYRPQYWQLRTSNGQTLAPCADAVADGASCVGPRYFDPLTAEENDQLIWMFQQSSVMDYSGDLTVKWLGLGAYDFAATRFFYGDTVSVYSDAGIRAGSKVGVGVTNATDTFGGLNGIRYSIAGAGAPQSIHYSQLQKEYGVISGCYPVTRAQPTDWNADEDGRWDSLLDGHVVKVGGGGATLCRQMPVDYAAWDDLRMPTQQELGGGWYWGGPSVDKQKRLRVPYPYASDRWADLGNASVYRQDMGADPYEIATYLVATQENRHVFDNFRRGRSDFSVRRAVNRSFQRYHLKLLGMASGAGFLASSYRRFAIAQGYSFDSLWPFVADASVRDNVVAASAIFDHFARALVRPEDGAHYLAPSKFDDPVLHSAKDPDGVAQATQLLLPNGSSGYYKDVGFGARPLENELSTVHGEYNGDYVQNAGSYYEKVNAAILFSLSEDRFISQSRGDFYDARFRASGLPDLFPEGWRRIVANALTGDRAMLAPHVAADASGKPLLDTGADTGQDPDARKYPARPIGWTSWWPEDGPQICFPSQGRNVCSLYGYLDGYFIGDFDPEAPASALPLDPQVGWEVQKFVIAWTLAYIPANQRTEWIDQLRLYRLGANAAPEMENRIEWQDPVSGEVWYAQTFGTECLFGSGGGCSGGKKVQRGIAARVLEYANELTAKGYKLDTATSATGFNAYGRAMVVRQPDGTPVVAADPAVVKGGAEAGSANVTCDRNVDPGCKPLTVFDNRASWQLSGYKSVPEFLWQTLLRYRLASTQQLGMYGGSR